MGLETGTEKLEQMNSSFPFSSRSCPICAALTDALIEHLSRRQKILADDDAAQNEYAASGGYCPFHTWQLAAFSSSKGIAAGHRQFLEFIAERMEEFALHATAHMKLPVLANKNGCPLCMFVLGRENELVRSFLWLLDDSGDRLAYAESQGLCLYHLRMACAASASTDVVRFLLQTTAEQLHKITRAMQGYVRKHNALERHLLERDEKDASYRALVKIAGGKQLSVPMDRHG